MSTEWKGYAIHDTSKWSEFSVIDFQPKRAEDYDVDIKIQFCGVCGTDVHTITAGWGQPMLPLIPGHEIVGTVERVGPKVTEFKVGDLVGVGAQACSCFECHACKSDNEQYCSKLVYTYNAKYPNGDIAIGGYATRVRTHEHFVFPIPAGLAPEQAAPLMCAGLTVYSPLKRYGAGPGRKVGVIGIGGLGHLAVQFAKALGAEVYVFSRSLSKKDDVMKMGADYFVTTEEGFAEPLRRELDLIICAADVSRGIPLPSLLSMLTVSGKCIMVALPDDALPALTGMDLARGVFLGGSHLGSKKEAIEMLNLAEEKGVKTWVELLPMSKCGEAVKNVKNGHVRYRHVLQVDI